MTEHAKRVLEAIRAGADQKSRIARATCLSQSSVTEALRELRKSKLVEESGGKYAIKK